MQDKSSSARRKVMGLILENLGVALRDDAPSLELSIDLDNDDRDEIVQALRTLAVSLRKSTRKLDGATFGEVIDFDYSRPKSGSI